MFSNILSELFHGTPIPDVNLFLFIIFVPIPLLSTALSLKYVSSMFKRNKITSSGDIIRILKMRAEWNVKGIIINIFLVVIGFVASYFFLVKGEDILVLFVCFLISILISILLRLINFILSKKYSIAKTIPKEYEYLKLSKSKIGG